MLRAAAFAAAAAAACCCCAAAAAASGSGSSSTPTVTLSNGVEMPLLLFGTPSCLYGKAPGTPADPACVQGAEDAVALALPLGFVGIDTAAHYGNQAGVAKGIARAGVARADVWITSKIEACNNSFVRLGHCANDTRAVFEKNLASLASDKIDLMLLHAPTSTGGMGGSVYPNLGHTPPCDCAAADACEAMQQQWAVLEELYTAGKARAIGVSNYCVACLDCLAKTSTVTPHVNQIRIHAGMDALTRPEALPQQCLARKIVPQAYSPLGGGSANVLGDALLKEIGVAHGGVSTAQVALRWLTQKHVPAITSAKASQTAYMKEDLAIFNWTLTAAEVSRIDAASFANETTQKGMCLGI
jgi:2,5-diketo-D-gluconate reductase A